MPKTPVMIMIAWQRRAILHDSALAPSLALRRALLGCAHRLPGNPLRTADVLGGSKAAAIDLAREGLLDILSSDYIPSSLLRAAATTLRLMERGPIRSASDFKHYAVARASAGAPLDIKIVHVPIITMHSPSGNGATMLARFEETQKENQT